EPPVSTSCRRLPPCPSAPGFTTRPRSDSTDRFRSEAQSLHEVEAASVGATELPLVRSCCRAASPPPPLPPPSELPTASAVATERAPLPCPGSSRRPQALPLLDVDLRQHDTRGLLWSIFRSSVARYSAHSDVVARCAL
ncbi:unnamed protein product, partial [Urochloa humidicola]